MILRKNLKMFKSVVFGGVFLFLSGCVSQLQLPASISPPILTNNPHKDVILTNSRPLLSFFNSNGGKGKRKYTIQIDKVYTFDSINLIEYINIPETSMVTSKLIEKADKLDDNTTYYWRVRAQDATMQQSPWAVSRFFLDTSSDDKSLNIARVTAKSVKVSSGRNKKNLIDIGDKAAKTYWEGAAKRENYWVEFDLGKPIEISRIWLLFDKSGLDGRPKSYEWQYGNNGADWNTINTTITKDSDAFRRIIDTEDPVTARYFRLNIQQWYGKFPKICEIILYSSKVSILPEVIFLGSSGFCIPELKRLNI